MKEKITKRQFWNKFWNHTLESPLRHSCEGELDCFKSEWSRDKLICEHYERVAGRDRFLIESLFSELEPFKKELERLLDFEELIADRKLIDSRSAELIKLEIDFLNDIAQITAGEENNQKNLINKINLLLNKIGRESRKR